VALQPVVSGLLRMLEHVPAERGLRLQCLPMAPDLGLRGVVTVPLT